MNAVILAWLLGDEITTDYGSVGHQLGLVPGPRQCKP